MSHPIPAQYRKRPVVIDAMQWDGANTAEVVRWIRDGHSGDPASAWWERHAGSPESIAIRTLEGVMSASVGDWVVRGVQGEHYPVKPDIFAATYEPVAEVAA